MTKILTLDPLDIDHSLVKEAAAVLHRGGLVAFPTETVYGVGADVFNQEAVRKIFASKVRSLGKPLAVCVSDSHQLRQVTASIPEEAEVIIEAFLPGPITLILPKQPTISDQVTARAKGVGIRFPNHAIALALIKEVGIPMATTSANISGGPDAKTAGEVISQLRGRIDLLIDGGPAQLGIPSTVIDFTALPYRIVRHGAISKQELDGFLRGKGLAELETRC